MVPSLTEMRRAVSRRLRAISRPAARTALSTSGGAVFGGFRAALPRCRHGLAGSRLPVGKWHRRSVEHRGLLPHQADPAGDRVVYQNMLAFQASVMAVDPAGNVYLAGNDFVQKLNTDGTDSQGAVYLLVNGIDAQSSTVVYYLIKLTQRGIGSFTRTCSRFRPRSWR